MDWSGLQDFLAVAETGSLSAAARRLGVSQPTVGRRLAVLERSLEAQLFVRSPRGLDLTAAGESILDHARRMSAEAAAAARMVGGRDRALGGSVRVSATEGLGVNWLLPRLAPFRARYPGIRIDLVVDNFAVSLARREADIAIRLFRPRQDGLVARRMGRLGFGLYAAHDYLERRGTPASLADLARHDLVGFDDSFGHVAQARWIRTHFKRDQVTLTVNSLLAQVAAVRAGYGISVLAHAAVDGIPGLARLLPEVAPTEAEIWLVSHSDFRRSARIRAMFDFLAELLTAHRAELGG